MHDQNISNAYTLIRYPPSPLEWDIWVEGYRASGDSSDAIKLNEFPIKATSFDEAVETFTKENSIKLDEPRGWERCKHTMWACCLFPTEEEARKSFG